MTSSSDFASVSEMDYLNTLNISELFTYLKSAPDSGNFKKVKRTLISRHDKMVKDLELHKNKCSQLMNEHVGLEKKVKDLEFDKIQNEGVINNYKEKVIHMEEDYENVCEVKEKVVKRVVELGKQNGELKCGKERSEEEIEAQKRRYTELEVHKNKCAQLMNKLNGKKNEIVGLEKKVEDLEFDKIQNEGVINKYKEKVIHMEKYFQDVSEVKEKAVKRVVELSKQNGELKCGKVRAQKEVEAQKRRYKELEMRVTNYARGFRDIISFESHVQEKTDLELVNNVVSDHEGEIHESDRIELNGGLDGALLKIKDGTLSCDGNVPDSASAYSICNSPVNDSDGGLNEGQPIVNVLLNPVASTKEQTNFSAESDNASGLRISKMGFEVRGCSCKLNSPKLGVQRLTSGDITESVDSEHKSEADPEQSLSFTIVKMTDSNHTGEEIWSVKRKAAKVRGETDSTDDDYDQIPLSKRKVKLAKKAASGTHCRSHFRGP